MGVKRLKLWSPEPTDWHITAARWTTVDSLAYLGGQILSGNFYGVDSVSGRFQENTVGAWGQWKVQHRSVEDGQVFLTESYNPASSSFPDEPSFGQVYKCVNDPEAWYMRYTGAQTASIFFRRGSEVSAFASTDDEYISLDQPFVALPPKNGSRAYYVIHAIGAGTSPTTPVFIRRVMNMTPTVDDVIVKIANDGVGDTTGCMLFADAQHRKIWFGTNNHTSYGGSTTVLSNPCGLARFDEDLNLEQEWAGAAQNVDNNRFLSAFCGDKLAYNDSTLIPVSGTAVLRVVQIQVSQPFPELARFDYAFGPHDPADIAGPVDFGGGLAWLQDGLCEFCDHNRIGLLATGC